MDEIFYYYDFFNGPFYMTLINHTAKLCDKSNKKNKIR